MSKQKDVPTITMTEEQLERVIKTAVKNALYEMKNEEKELPGLDEDELAAAATTFVFLKMILIVLFVIIGISSLLCAVASIKDMTQNGIYWQAAVVAFDFGGIAGISVFAIIEIAKTKKLEVLNTIFSAIMALAGLIVAIIGAVFAYKAL